MAKTITVQRTREIAPYSGENAIDKIRFRPVRQALGVSSWGMSVLEFDPHCEGYPEHDHADDGHEEVYLVLEGSLVLRTGGEERELTKGDFVHVPGELARKFVTRDVGATLLALGGTPGKPYQPSLGRPR